MSDWVNVSHLLAELPVGFEEIDHGLFNVYFGPRSARPVPQSQTTHR